MKLSARVVPRGGAAELLITSSRRDCPALQGQLCKDSENLYNCTLFTRPMEDNECLLISKYTRNGNILTKGYTYART